MKTKKEVCEWLKITPEELYYYIEKDDLPYLVDNEGSFIFCEDDIKEDWLKQRVEDKKIETINIRTIYIKTGIKKLCKYKDFKYVISKKLLVYDDFVVKIGFARKGYWKHIKDAIAFFVAKESQKDVKKFKCLQCGREVYNNVKVCYPCRIKNSAKNNSLNNKKKSSEKIVIL